MARKRAATSAPPAGSRVTSRTVSSPAMVPRMDGITEWSIARARKFAAPGGGPEHHEVSGGLGGDQQFAAEPGEARVQDFLGNAALGSAFAALAGDRVDQDTFLAADPDGAEFHQVPGQGGLGDLHAVVRQQGRQLGLGADGFAGQDRGDPGLAGRLGGRAGALRGGLDGHQSAPSTGARPSTTARPERCISQAIRAFCACSRFSASSQTTDCGPSITPAEIS